jgi:hypothetical protein
MTDTVTSATLESLGTRRRAGQWRLFLTLVALATFLPFVIAPLAASGLQSSTSVIYTYSAILFLGANFHVALTGWFLTDPEMRAHFRSRPLRYFVVPGILILGTAAAFGLGGESTTHYLLVPFAAWLLWHYQKQNIGLLGFIAAGTDRAPLSVWERRTLMLAGIAGILGFFAVSEPSRLNLAAEFAFLHQVGVAVYLLVPFAFLAAVMTTPSLRTNRLRLLYFLAGSLFFLPSFIFTDQMAAVTGYALAHGLQYVVFMGFVSTSTRTSTMKLVVFLLAAAVVGVTLDYRFVIANVLANAYGLALLGALTGIVMAHFVMDAAIWRLREPFQRGYMRKKFSFVFDH